MDKAYSKEQLKKQLGNLCTSYANLIWNNQQELDFSVAKAEKLEQAIWAWIDKNFIPLELPVIVQGELLPCPFCGNEKVKVIEYEAICSWRCVQCNKCKGQFYFFNKGVNIGVGRGTTQQRKQRIIDAWNKRAGREPQTK